MNHLLRELAPISAEGWDAIEDEAKPRLTTYLAARKLVDFSEPKGWQHSATPLGRVEAVEGPAEGVSAAARRVLPLVELRASFAVSRAELSDVDRGATDADFSDLVRAAERIAVAENSAVFRGYPPAGIRGIAETASQPEMTLGPDVKTYPARVAEAVGRLLESGIGGPYGLAVSPEGYTSIIQSTELGDLMVDHVRQILGGPVVPAPGLTGGVVMSLRGGDFVIDCGQDLSIGYLDHTVTEVRLYFEESFNFRAIEPDAAVILKA